jgi:hypothetical protein
MRYRFIVWTLVFSGLHLCAQTKQADSSFTVLVLDALSGKPQPNVTVGYNCTPNDPHGLNSPEESSLTGPNGATRIVYRCAANEKVAIGVDNIAGRKLQCGGLDALTLQEITSKGIVAQPGSAGSIWCPDKVSKKLKPQPGQVILFVKKPTWWQSHIAG